jgi:predicted nucleic acid-binding protein
MASFVVVYDACVLYPFHLRDLLVRLAASGLFRAKWTDAILDECFESLRSNRPDLDSERLARTRQLMCTAVRDCLVTGYEPLVEGLDLPDPDDRHVLAAAVRCHAQVIVTWNLGDFPTSTLEPFDVEAQSPDRFVRHLVDLAPARVAQVLTEQASALDAPPLSLEELMRLLRRDGLTTAMAALEEYRG